MTKQANFVHTGTGHCIESQQGHTVFRVHCTLLLSWLVSTSGLPTFPYLAKPNQNGLATEPTLPGFQRLISGTKQSKNKLLLHCLDGREPSGNRVCAIGLGRASHAEGAMQSVNSRGHGKGGVKSLGTLALQGQRSFELRNKTQSQTCPPRKTTWRLELDPLICCWLRCACSIAWKDIFQPNHSCPT